MNTKDYIEEYIIYLKNNKNYSINTTESYKRDLLEFTEYLEENDITLKNADINWIRGFVAYISYKGDKAKTLNRKISSLKGFFKYLHSRNYIKTNPSVSLKGVKEPKDVPSFLTERQMEELLDKMEYEGKEGARDRAILEMLYATGIRASELINLNILDVDFGQKNVRVLGKGKKERYVPFGNRCYEALKDYLLVRDRFPIKDANEEALFLGIRGRRLNRKSLYNIVHKYIMQVGSLPQMSPHTLRHTFATHLLKQGADIRFVQELLGHSNPSTTQKYTHLNIDYLKQVYKNSHPHGKKEK